jgi:hypothetical protein
MQYLGYTNAKPVLIVYLKFKFNWVSCLSSANDILSINSNLLFPGWFKKQGKHWRWKGRSEAEHEGSGQKIEEFNQGGKWRIFEAVNHDTIL